MKNEHELFWVEPDPGREIAVDALGLASQADRLADALLPKMSVLTRRARYLSFLCWARQRSKNISELYVLEGELTITSAKLMSRDPQHYLLCPAVIGRRRVLDAQALGPVRQATRLYKRRAFPDYRSLMRSLRLTGAGSFPMLLEAGKALADAYKRNHSPCLCKLSPEERTILKQKLGFDARTNDDIDGRKRRETFHAVRDLLKSDSGDGVVSPGQVLSRFSTVPKRGGDGAPGALHRAYVWELASVALELTFALLAQRLDAGSVASELSRACRQRPQSPGIATTLRTDDDDACANVVALAREANRLHRNDPRLEHPAWILIETLVRGDTKTYVRTVLRRHSIVKAHGEWIRLSPSSGKVVRTASDAKQLPKAAEVRSYRLRALSDLSRDLGMLR